MNYTRFGISNYWNSAASSRNSVLEVDDLNIKGEPGVEDITGGDDVYGGNPTEDFLDRFAKYIGGSEDDDTESSETSENEVFGVVELSPFEEDTELFSIVDGADQSDLEEVGIELEESPSDEVEMVGLTLDDNHEPQSYNSENNGTQTEDFDDLNNALAKYKNFVSR